MSRILESLPSVMCNMDEMIIFGETQEQHDERLIEILRRFAQAGVTLNEKCKFKVFGSCDFYFEGIKADPDKVSAIKNVNSPTDVRGVRRFLEMVN